MHEGLRTRGGPVSEYRTMTTGKLLRLLGSRDYRRKHEAELRFYGSFDPVDYTDDMDARIVDEVSSILEDRIDDASHRATLALER